MTFAHSISAARSRIVVGLSAPSGADRPQRSAAPSTARPYGGSRRRLGQKSAADAMRPMERAGLNAVNAQLPQPTPQLTRRPRRKGQCEHMARIDLPATDNAAIRWVSARVLPVPAPARTHTGASGAGRSRAAQDQVPPGPQRAWPTSLRHPGTRDRHEAAAEHALTCTPRAPAAPASGSSSDLPTWGSPSREVDVEVDEKAAVSGSARSTPVTGSSPPCVSSMGRG